MSKIISSFTNRLIHKGHIPEEDREIYIYGFDITLYTIWSTSILLLTGLVLRQFTAAVVLVFGFYTFQTTGGGYHADTHLKCLLTMFIGLLAGLSFVYLKDHQILLWILLNIGAILLLLFPLALHPNRSHLKKKKTRLIMKSIVVTLSFLLFTVILNIFWNRMLHAFAAVFLLAGISRISGKVIYGRMNSGEPLSH